MTIDLISRIKHDFTDCVVLVLKVSLFKSMKDIILFVTYIFPEGNNTC